MNHDDQNLVGWMKKALGAISDQALFVVASSVLNLLLARWLAPKEYGAFAVTYSILLFAGAFHTSFFTEPMLIFGAGRYSSQVTEYLGFLLRWHWIATGTCAILLIVAGIILGLAGLGALARSFIGVGIAVPFTLLMWLTRRAAYTILRPRLSATASAVYLCCIAFGLTIMYMLKQVSSFGAFCVIAFAGFVAGLWMVKRLGLNWLGSSKPVHGEESPIKVHWNYARWALAGNLLTWVPLNFFFVVLSVSVNLNASATLRAVANIVLPALQTNAALSTLLLPYLSKRQSTQSGIKPVVKLSLIVFITGNGLYGLGIALAGPFAIHALYGGKYDMATRVVWLFALVPVFDGMTSVFSSALRSMQRPDTIFWTYLTAAVCVLTAGVAAASIWGITGAAAAILASGIITTMMMCGLTVTAKLSPRLLPARQNVTFAQG